MQTYKVKKGDTLWGIATLYNTSTDAIVIENGIVNEDLIQEGDTLKIPVRNKMATSLSAVWNKELVREGRKQIRKRGGQCKTWIQKLALETCGIDIPINNPDVEYKNEWVWDSNPKNIQRKGLYQTTPVKEGDILQLLWDKNIVNQKYHWHTAIYIKKSGDDLTLLDSNWKGKERVSEHVVSYSWFQKTMLKGTVYTLLK